MFRDIEEFPKSNMSGANTAEKRAPVSRDKRNGTVTVSLRIPEAMLKEIDRAVKRRPYRMPRHMWLLEALHEKLSRANAEGREG